jgi:transposase
MNFPLSDADKMILYKLHKSANDKRNADKIKMISLLDRGYSQKEIASILMLDEDTISAWLKKINLSSDFSAYLRDNYSSYYGKLTSEEKERIKDYIRNNIITDCRQVISSIEENFAKSYSLSGMQKLLSALGFSYKQLSLFPSKLDAEKQKEFWFITLMDTF